MGVHCVCYPDMKTDIGRGLGCELVLHLSRTLLQKSAAIKSAALSPSPCFSFIHSVQIKSRNWSPGRLLSFFSASSFQLRSLNCLWVRGCRSCNAEEPKAAQPSALLQVQCDLEPWAGAGYSQMGISQGRSCTSSFSGANRESEVRGLDQGAEMFLEGSTDFPCS